MTELPVRNDDTPPAVPAALVRAASVTWRLLVLAAGAFLVLTLLSLVGPVLLALFMAGLLTALAGPVMRRLERFLPRVVSMALALLLIGGLIATILTIVVRSVIAEGPKVVTSVQAGLAWLEDWLRNGPLNLSDDTFAALVKEVTSLGTEIGSQLLSDAGALLGSAGTVITAGSVFIFAVIFFMMAPESIWSFVLSWVPRRSRAHVDTGGRIAWDSLAGYTRGIVVVALLDALLVFIGLLVLQVPLAPVLAALVFLGAFIPVIGAPVATAFAAVVALAERGPLIAILVIVLTIIVGSFDGDVLQPLVMGRAVNLHPLAIVILIAGGAIGFGIIGALIAVPIGSAVYGVMKYAAGRDPDHPLSPSDAALADDTR